MLEQRLATERAFRSQLIENLRALLKTVTTAFSDRTVFDAVLNLDPSQLVVGKEDFEDVRKRFREDQRPGGFRANQRSEERE